MNNIKDDFKCWLIKQGISDKLINGKSSTLYEYVRQLNVLSEKLYNTTNWDLLAENAPILILDEVTSALDNKTENDVIETLNNLMKNKTVITIAHRLSTLKNMDRIIVIDKGKIVEDGHPLKLLSKEGEFQKFWKLQK